MVDAFRGRVNLAVLPLVFSNALGRDGANPKDQRRFGRLGLRIFPGLRTLRGMTELGLIHPIRGFFGSDFHFGWVAFGVNQREDAFFWFVFWFRYR